MSLTFLLICHTMLIFYLLNNSSPLQFCAILSFSVMWFENRVARFLLEILRKDERGILLNFLRFCHVNNHVIVFPLASARSHELLSDKITYAMFKICSFCEIVQITLWTALCCNLYFLFSHLPSFEQLSKRHLMNIIFRC